MVTNGFSLRSEQLCRRLATTSLPVPFSPVMSTLAFVAPIFSIRSFRSFIACDSPIINRTLFPATGRLPADRRDTLSSKALSMMLSNFELSQGLGIKSVAPAFIARTTFSVSTYAVSSNTTTLGFLSKIKRNHL